MLRRILRMVLVAMTGVLLTTGYAAAEDAQQDKLKTCNTIATQRGINGDAREEFIKVCLSAGGEAAGANPQQEKMKTCNADATAKNLTGDDLDAFMKSCLSGK